jgi:hypothetical protein
MPVKRYQEFIPHPALQDYVKRFWILEKDYTAEDSVEEVIPDACVELILNFGVGYVQIDGSTPRELPKVCLIGLQSKPLILQANGVVKIVGVRFFAWGAHPFLENEAQRGGAKRIELDDALRDVVLKIEAKVHAGAYQDAVIVLHEARSEDDRALVGKQMGSYPFLGLDNDDCIGEYQRMKRLGVKFHDEFFISTCAA